MLTYLIYKDHKTMVQLSFPDMQLAIHFIATVLGSMFLCYGEYFFSDHKEEYPFL